jgi:hypothetical protein
VDGTSENRGGKVAARYVTPSIGVEASLFKYVAASVFVGTRVTGRFATPALEGSVLNGPYVSFGLEFGTFR